MFFCLNAQVIYDAVCLLRRKMAGPGVYTEDLCVSPLPLLRRNGRIYAYLCAQGSGGNRTPKRRCDG